jgi:hypothetical protein
MNKQIKRYCVTICVGLFIYSICSPISYARIEFNWRECASAPGCSSTLTLLCTDNMVPTMKSYTIESAGYFMKSHAAYQEFLNLVEMSESNSIDSEEFKNNLYNAINNMEKSKAAYTNLKIASEKIPYHQEMINQLIKFDYDGFREKYGLNEPIFEKLRTFLGKGDIAGFDAAVIANMDAILINLYEIKGAVDKGLTPEISNLWRISQAYAEAQLFGQYMSEVFSDILF